MASDTVYDVVVVGGGIGGFTFGRACALKSLRTIVWAPPPPRHHTDANARARMHQTQMRSAPHGCMQLV
ncbi:hypothetical protein EON67_09360 [archaeon]|nr:MAG: hypothetical protein EON67_09360 [archaeon]